MENMLISIDIETYDKLKSFCKDDISKANEAIKFLLCKEENKQGEPKEVRILKTLNMFHSFIMGGEQ